MKKITGLLLFFFFLTTLVLAGCNGVKKEVVSGEKDTLEEVDHIKVINLSVIDENESLDFEVDFWEGMSAFDLLKKVSEINNFQMDYEDSPMGVYIKELINKREGTNNKYWLYYVNGEMPNVAVDKKILKSGDKVEFKFLPLEQ